MAESSVPTQLRVDVWLDVSCVCRTRSEAQRACSVGRVSVNGERAKPRRELKTGDRVTIVTRGRRRELVVRRLSEHHLPKAEARGLYEDVTPPPAPEDAELRELLRRAGPAAGARQGAPRRREQRLRRHLKGF